MFENAGNGRHSGAQLNRRKLLSCAIGAGAAATAPELIAATSEKQEFFRRHRQPLGLQLYSIGDIVDSDIDLAVREVASIGYRTVELPAPLGRPAAKFARALHNARLRCTSIHIDPAMSPAANAEDAHALGCSHVISGVLKFPSEPPAYNSGAAMGEFLIRSVNSMTTDDWKRSADNLNQVGNKFRRLGLRFGYHNHNHEFVTPSGSAVSGYEILLAETDPAAVTFQLDVGWAAAAGRDPAELLRSHLGRFRLMHIKDVGPRTKTNFMFQQEPADVGSGILDWRRILPAAYASGVRDYFVEREPPFPVDSIDSARRSFAF